MKILKASIPSVALIAIIALLMGPENRDLVCQGVYDVLTLQATNVKMESSPLGYQIAGVITCTVGIIGGVFGGITGVALMCSLTHKIYIGDLDKYFPKLW